MRERSRSSANLDPMLPTSPRASDSSKPSFQRLRMEGIVCVEPLCSQAGRGNGKFCVFLLTCNDLLLRCVLDYTSFLAKIISKSICESDSFSVLSNSLQTPWTLAHQAPLSMEVSRQECSSIHPLLQSISATQRSNPCLLHCRQILYCLSHCIYIYIHPCWSVLGTVPQSYLRVCLLGSSIQ